MSISEQVKELKWYASYQDCEKIRSMMYQAADTIESLSAKLQAANMERSEDCGGWIYCGDGKNLPKSGKRYQVTAIWKDEDFEKRSVYDAVYGSDGQWHGEDYIPVPYKVVAWRLLPEPYKADMEGHRENTTLRALRAISDAAFCENLKNGSVPTEPNCEFGEKQISDKAWAAYRKEQRALRKSKRK